MKAIPGIIYYTGRSFWYCESLEVFICMSDIYDANDGYIAKPGGFMSPARILVACDETFDSSEGDGNANL